MLSIWKNSMATNMFGGPLRDPHEALLMVGDCLQRHFEGKTNRENATAEIWVICGSMVDNPRDALSIFDRLNPWLPSAPKGSEALDEVRKVYKSHPMGAKIQAIKKYRELFNVGLREAKDAVETLALSWN
jgi:hypothetical protein